MRKRLRQFCTLLSAIGLIVVVSLWIGGDRYGESLSVRMHVKGSPEARCFVGNSVLWIDWTLATAIVRNWEYPNPGFISIRRYAPIPEKLETLLDSAGPVSFRWRNEPDLRVAGVPPSLLVAATTILPALSIYRRLRDRRPIFRPAIRLAWRLRIAMVTALLIVVIGFWWLSITYAGYVRFGHAERERMLEREEMKGWMDVTLPGIPTLGLYDSSVHFEPIDLTSEDALDRSTPVALYVAYRAAPSKRWIEGVSIDRGAISAIHWPMWLLALPMVTCLGVAGAMRVLGRRMRPGFCAVCDYDLRFSTHRCSECGHLVDSRSSRWCRPTQRALFSLALLAFGVAGVWLAYLRQERTAWDHDFFLCRYDDAKSVQRYSRFVLRRDMVYMFTGSNTGWFNVRRSRPVKSLLLCPTWAPTLVLLTTGATAGWLAIRRRRPALRMVTQ